MSSPPARSHSWPKAFRLKRRRLIRALFDRGRDDGGTVAYGCVRLVYRVVPVEKAGRAVPVQAGFAPGRRCRRAVVRNRVKRVLRDVYRHHHHPLMELFAGRNEMLTLMVLFRGDPEAARRCVPADLPVALQRLHAALRRALAAPG